MSLCSGMTSEIEHDIGRKVINREICSQREENTDRRGSVSIIACTGPALRTQNRPVRDSAYIALMKSTDGNLRIQSVLSLARSSSVYSRSYHGRSRIRTSMSRNVVNQKKKLGRPVTFAFRISLSINTRAGRKTSRSPTGAPAHQNRTV